MMFRSLWYPSLLLAVILGLAVAPAETAQANGRRSNPAQISEEAFVAAAQAAAQGKADRFEVAAAQAQETLLRSYIDYWRLKLRQAQRPDPAQDLEAQAFIDSTDNALLADLARRDALYRLARRRDWQAFLSRYEAWVLRDEPALHCLAGVAQLESGRPMGEEAREALFQPRELGDGCGMLVDTMARLGKLSRDDAWARLKLALEAGAHGSVRKLGPAAGLTPGAVEAALQRSQAVLSPSTETAVAVIALGALARQDPELAARQSGAIAALPVAERAWVWAQIASQSMRRLAPVPTAWLKDAIPASNSDETWSWLVRAALRASDWQLVHQLIGRMSPAGQRDPTWVYWDARAHQVLGRRTQAEGRWRAIAGQFHFYGQLAAEELGEVTTIPAPAAPPTDTESAEATANPGLARALRLYALGMRPEANREWNFQLRGMNDRQLLAAARLACERKVLDRCVNTADRTRSEHDFSLRFVTPFRQQLEAAAGERGLDPAWVYGLIRQESRFIMDARSSASAQGLMQIIPPTARWIARRLGVGDFRLEQLNELDTNLRFGTYYLRVVHDDLENSPLLASAGYNAGPGRPRLWRSRLLTPLEGAAFAEIIPFAETRDYVKKVLSNATFYAALMTGRPQSLKQRLGQVAPAAMQPTSLP